MANPLKQYLDLYEQNRQLIDAGSTTAMNRRRDHAYNTLLNATLPDCHTEGYEKTDTIPLFAPDYGINLQRLNLPVDPTPTFRCDVPNLSTLLGIVANDRFIPTDTLRRNLPDGVIVTSLTKAAQNRKYELYIDDMYGLSQGNPLTQLNTLLAQDGLFIYIPHNHHLDKPIQIINLLQSTFPLAAFRRILIVAEPGSKADIILCDHTQNDHIKYLNSQVIETHLYGDARLGIYELEETSPQTTRISQLFAYCHGGDPHLNITNATLLNGTTRNEYYCDLGIASNLSLSGMAIGSGTQHIDNYTQVTHAYPHSTSDQHFKYVLDDKATGAFEGTITVAPGAQYTQAYQANNNILASQDARMHTKPQLLIYNDDVKCSHGATTGQLNTEALFYMQTRGIPLPLARTMLMQAFMVDIIDTIPLTPLRDRLRHLVEKRFDGTLNCPTCSHC